VEFEGKPVLWFTSARRHRIGKASAFFVMTNVVAVETEASECLDRRLSWVGPDERGRELEIVALDLPDSIIVIHVFPTSLRRQR
jgi:hypothetical protein